MKFTLLDFFEIFLVITALLITTRTSVKQVIRLYLFQSFLLAIITGFTAFNRLQPIPPIPPIPPIWLIGLTFLIVFLPLFLGASIEGLLAKATFGGQQLEDSPQGERIWPEWKGQNIGSFLLETLTVLSYSFAFLRWLWWFPGLKTNIRLSHARQEAERIWLKQESKSINVAILVIAGSLVALSFGIAFQAIPPQIKFKPPERIGLFVSIFLHLTGLYNMVVKRDIISQVVGLLTMDHGLYLAVVKIVVIPVPATFFVISLYTYTAITLAILVFMVPSVRKHTESIDLDEIASSSKKLEKLKG